MALPSATVRILLVEDNPGDARLLREILREGSLRFELTHAARLDEALVSLAAAPADVVLLDLSLPDAHGLETVRRTLEAAPDVPIVVLSGLNDETVAVEAVQAGAQDYLVKGEVTHGVVARSLRYAIRRKQMEVERRRLLESEREARERAEAAVRARDDVLHVVSHDLGNSLSAIVVNASVLLRALPEGAGLDEARGRAASVRELARQLQRVRQDLLDVASVEAGRLGVDPEPVEAGTLVRAALEHFAPLAAEKSVAVAAEGEAGEAGGVEVLADRERVLQVFANLVGNAIKFTGEGGRIVVSASPAEEGAVRFTVRDSGCGIPADHLTHVFDRFWRQREGNRSGTGLGLAIARGIVEAHGGRMWAESAPGEGSAFHFTLPAA